VLAERVVHGEAKELLTVSFKEIDHAASAIRELLLERV